MYVVIILKKYLAVVRFMLHLALAWFARYRAHVTFISCYAFFPPFLHHSAIITIIVVRYYIFTSAYVLYGERT